MVELNKKNKHKITLSLHKKGFSVVGFCRVHNLNIGTMKQFIIGAFKSQKIKDILKKEGISYER